MRVGTRIGAALAVAAAAFAFTAAPAQAAAGNADLLWHNAKTGELGAWLTDGHGKVVGENRLSWPCGPECASQWRVVGGGDFNNDFTSDVLWHNATTGELSAWILDGKGTVTSALKLDWTCGPACASQWKAVAIGDFNADNKSDIVWHNASTGAVGTWLLDGKGHVTGDPSLSWTCGPGCANQWKVAGAGDLNEDNLDDLLWHNATTGEVSAWLTNGKQTVTGALKLSWTCGPDCANQWKIVAVNDFGNDFKNDVAWHNATTGEVATWTLDGKGGVTGDPRLSWTCGAGCANDWKAVATGNFG
ncbi:FG-GAP repeat domain-containing protein [Amycolatopsis lurida]